MLLSQFVSRRFLRALPLSLFLAFSACGGDDGPADTDDGKDEKDASKPETGKPDAGRDTGTGKPDSGPRDAGPADPKLAPLAGRYLMRWDVLGTATSPNPVGGAELEIRSRVSTLVVADLVVDGDHLVGTERVCTQDIKQECLGGCDAASTSVDSRVINNFLLKKTQSRNYRLSEDGTFSGEPSVAQLGYDDEEQNAAPPTSSSDERVWDVDTSKTVREGFLSNVKVTLLVPITCKVYGVQKFATAFAGKLTGSESEPEFPEMDLDLTGSKGETLGSDPAACATQAETVDAPYDIHTSRMVRVGDATGELNCPAVSEFDGKLPPTEPNLGK